MGFPLIDLLEMLNFEIYMFGQKVTKTFISVSYYTPLFSF